MKNEKKNIDRLFQEKFRDFEVSPDNDVWKNIEKELKEDEEKKGFFIPLWIRFSGVAALFVGIALVGSLWNTPEKISVVSTEEENTKEIKSSFEIPEFIIESAEIENNKAEEKEENSTFGKSEKQENIASATVENIVEVEENINTKNKLSEKYLAENKVDLSIENTSAEENNQQDFLVENQKDFNNKTENKKKSLLDEIAKVEENKEEKTTKKLKNRWAINPNFSPIYYSSLSGGSAVDPILSDHKTEGEITMSYGIDFSYAVNEKLKVRTGISKINMSYHTADVAFSASSQGKTLKGVENNIQAKNIRILNSQTNAEPKEFSTESVPFTEGKLNQQFEYLEIPVEIEFALIEERFGVNIIGGASTLLLSNDAVRINSAGGTTELGRAENLNSVSFTTNIGVGIDYNFTEKLKFNIEPSFKYQVNGFQGSTNGFRPYYLGLYSGVSFKF